MQSYTVSDPMSLVEALAKCFPDSSKRTLLQWIKNGRIVVDDQISSKPHTQVAPGQTLQLKSKEVIKPKLLLGVEILYQDRWIVVINKPPGLLSVASENPQHAHALGIVRDHFRSDAICAVHRIDRETSGVLLFARGSLVQEKFDHLFETHTIDREYVAVLEGQLPEEKGTWQHYLKEKESFDVVLSDEVEGKLATTHFEVYRRSNLFTYVRLKLETGRKHQIRVQCQLAGHPVVGDQRYGSGQNPLKRMCLHAYLLGFVHPFTGKKMTFQSPLPRPFERLGVQLEL